MTCITIHISSHQRPKADHPMTLWLPWHVTRLSTDSLILHLMFLQLSWF